MAQDADTADTADAPEADTEVLVVGAGPTGLTLAAGLLRRGVRVRVIDRAERASPHSKAITLWPRALEIFETMGIGQEMYDRGVKLVATSYYTGNRRIGRIRMRPLAGTRFQVPISLPQTTTEELLREAVVKAGGSIEFGLALESLSQEEGHALARLSDGSTLRVPWVVGCDGAYSTVREHSGVAFEGATYPQTFVIVDGHYDTEYAHDESYYLMGPTGVIVVVGLPGGLYRVFASVPPGESPEDPVGLVGRLLEKNSPLPITPGQASGSGSFQIHRKQAARMRIGRVLLAGDAAHIHSPAGGLGLNTGVQDAGSLSWRLAGVLRRGVPETVLDQWEAERLFVAGQVIAETDQQTRMWMLKGWRRVRRDVLIDLGLRTGLLERVLPRRIAQLDLRLPVQGPARRGLRPGLRIADVPLGDGRRLHDLLAPGGHLLLAFGPHSGPGTAALDLPSPADPSLLHVVRVGRGPAGHGAAGTALDDPGGRLRRALGARQGTVCLVRPDTVIAAAAALGDPAGVRAVNAALARVRGTRTAAPAAASGTSANNDAWEDETP
ncbi:FAD-dependent monooxygenase [Streptomyces hoynatensis]|uniref:Oxygenase n=1 Tax=Streptomyces hoynatensis TaxID=1141874 RepID=A0A3A9ZEZ5_9ACTN|nr:FAD-dependent monooxygenase [Streptomyces hoynatensis]RKN47022.1 oxygenase [Streptomyces hoynatensis]